MPNQTLSQECREAVQRVSQHLTPSRVLLQTSYVDLAKMLDFPEREIGAQIGFPLLGDIHEGDFEGKKKYRLQLVTGIRFVPADLLDENDETIEQSLIGQIQGHFLIEFDSMSSQEIALQDMKAFGVVNAPLIVWPYFRELCHTACGKAGVKAPPIGLYRLERFSDAIEASLKEVFSEDGELFDGPQESAPFRAPEKRSEN